MVVKANGVVASEKYRVGAIMISSRAQFVPHPLWRRQPAPPPNLHMCPTHPDRVIQCIARDWRLECLAHSRARNMHFVCGSIMGVTHCFCWTLGV